MNTSAGGIKARRCKSPRPPSISHTDHNTAVSANVSAARWAGSAEPEWSREVRLLHTSFFLKPPLPWSDAQDAGITAALGVFVPRLLRELGDSITKSDVVRQQKLVVLQLNHIMRIKHERSDGLQENRWCGFEYSSLEAPTNVPQWGPALILVADPTTSKSIGWPKHHFPSYHISLCFVWTWLIVGLCVCVCVCPSCSQGYLDYCW